MKRIIIILIGILCCSLCKAQQTYLSEDSLKAIHSYVARQYVDAWVNVHSKDVNYETYQLMKTYCGGVDKIIFNELDYENAMILKKIGWDGGCNIYKYVMNERFSEWNNVDGNIDRINSSMRNKLGDNYNSFESEINRKRESIKKTIDEFYNHETTMDDNCIVVEKIEEKTFLNLLFHQSFFVFIIDLLLGALVCLVVATFIYKFKNKEKMNVLLPQNHDLNGGTFREIINVKEELSNIKSSLNKIQYELSESSKAILSVGHLVENSKTSSIIQDVPTKNGSIEHSQKVVGHNPSKIIYAIVGCEGTFMECGESEEYQYKLMVYNNPKESEFELMSKIEYVKNNKSAVLEGYCDVLSAENHATKIIIEKKGVARIGNDEKWHVFSKSQIKLKA